MLHDLTDAGWRWRVLRRIGIQIIPVVVIAALIPGIDALARGLLIALIVFSALFTVGISTDALRDRRLRQHGFDPGPDEDERYREARRRM